jgi:hypothetical protein
MYEISFYRTVVKDCKDAVHKHFTTPAFVGLSSLSSTVFRPPSPGAATPAGCGPACVHYSFNVAQQVHYPQNPLQPGPMYFKTARKYAILGVVVKGYHTRSTTSLMRHRTLVRELTLSSVCFTMFWQTMTWDYNCTLTIVQDRTKITQFCNI